MLVLTTSIKIKMIIDFDVLFLILEKLESF